MLRNCIVWNNTARRAGTHEIFNDAALGKRIDITHSNVKGGWAGTGNIDSDPLFVDPAGGDYRLQAASPCRDTGNNAALPDNRARLDWNTVTTRQLPNDLRMAPRINGDRVDMGTYEWVPAQP